MIKNKAELLKPVYKYAFTYVNKRSDTITRFVTAKMQT